MRLGVQVGGARPTSGPIRAESDFARCTVESPNSPEEGGVMRQVMSWVARVGVGLVRAGVVVIVSMVVPAVWAAAVAVAIWWSGNPWTWIPLFVLSCVWTVGLSRPVCRMFRYLVARWTGIVIPAGYREAPPVTQLSTGLWWNGFT